MKVKTIIGVSVDNSEVRCGSACHHKSSQKTQNTSKGGYTSRGDQFLCHHQGQIDETKPKDVSCPAANSLDSVITNHIRCIFILCRFLYTDFFFTFFLCLVCFEVPVKEQPTEDHNSDKINALHKGQNDKMKEWLGLI